MKRLCKGTAKISKISFAALAISALALLPGSGASQSTNPSCPSTSSTTSPGFCTLLVGEEEVRIYRDEFGVPHIFAESNRGLFEAFGYVVAQDRLWQLELNRRAGYGRLAEIFGPGSVPADRLTRTIGYTGAELDTQFAELNSEEQEIIGAYVDGINRYINEVVTLNPAEKLPFEFHHLGIGIPETWRTRDVVAVTVRTVRPPPATGRELVNQTLLNSLIAAHGPVAALGIFDDVYWLNDPDAPVSVPIEGAFDKRQKALPPPHPAQLQGASENPPDPLEAQSTAVLESLGIPTRLGSHGWVVSAAKSANGFAMLFGGPQQGFPTPSVVHEVQLHGGNGFNATGTAIAGFLPAVTIGRTDHVAWTFTVGLAADLIDHYIETLCGAGSGYLFNGICTPFETRSEVIQVRGAAPVSLTVRRSVHGPVVGSCPASPGVCFSQKRAFWQREMQGFRTVLAFDRARNIQEFEEGVKQMVTSFNVLYADKVGNIAYWLGGQVPVRPAGFDPRLPFPGDGSAEWPGGFLPIPTSINPTRGWLASWNNKPRVDYDTPDRVFGKQFRVLEIEAQLETGLISLEEMRHIATDIARDSNDGTGRDSRFLKPYLLAALDVVPPSHALASQARAVLEAWDGSDFADAITSTTLEPGQVIFSAWLDRMLTNTFGDEMGTGNDLTQLRTKVGGTGVGDQGTPIVIDMLIHVLDDALGGGSGVPPSRDYFNGVDPNLVMSQTFDQALAALGPNPAAWSQPRGTIRFRHALFPVVPEVGTIPESNRGTYAQIVVLSRPKPNAESIVPLGQSGFIQGVPPAPPVFDPHFKDQLELYRNFQYKPMHLFSNSQLQE